MTGDEAVERLEDLARWNLENRDNEATHGRADDILIDAADPQVRAAYKRVMDTCSWWACS